MEHAVVVAASAGDVEFAEVPFHRGDPASGGFDVVLPRCRGWELVFREELESQCFGRIACGDGGVRHGALVDKIRTTTEGLLATS